MLNYFINNNLSGLNKNQMLCTCGHIAIKDDSISPLTKCPNCEAYELKKIDSISFIPQDIKSTLLVYNKDEESHGFKFTIDFAYIETSIKTLFTKQRVEFIKNKTHQEHYQLIFDGTKPIDEMIVYKNVDNDVYIDKDILIEKLKNRDKGITLKNFESARNLKYAIGLDFPYFYEFHKVEDIIDAIDTRLRKFTNYCSEHEILIKAGINPYKLNGELDMTATNPAGQLKLNPFMVKFLRDKGEVNHKALQFIQENLGNQAVNYLNTFGALKGGLQIYNIRKVMTLVNNAQLSIKKLYKFLYVDAPAQQGLFSPDTTLQLLYDSYDLATKLELPFDKNPKALERYHDILVREYNVVSDNRKNEMFADVMKAYKKMEFIESREEENEEEQQVTLLEGGIPPKKKRKELYAMILPKDAQDLVLEGKRMRHCVATYVDRVIKEQSLIFFLRRAKDLNESYVTVEVDPDDFHIKQVKGKTNSRLKNPEAEKFLKKWCKLNNVKWNGCW